MDSRKISVSLFVLVAIIFCLVGEISSQDANENLLYVMFYPQLRLIGQPLSIGPACYELTGSGQVACESTAGCMWTAEASCRSISSDSPATVTMPGDCSNGKNITLQKIVKYNSTAKAWVPVVACSPPKPVNLGGGLYRCSASDGRVMTWDTNTCTISADLVARPAELQTQAHQISILNFLFNAIEKGNVVIFTLAIAIAFAIGLYISEVISKPKKSWKRYIKKNPKKVRKSSRKKSRKR